MTFNGPDDAMRVSIEADREIAKLNKLVEAEIARRDAADAFYARWRAAIRGEGAPLPPVDSGATAIYEAPNGAHSEELPQ